MKTTVEIPDALFRDAKAAAASRGLSLKRFLSEAIREKLAAPVQRRSPGWPVPPPSIPKGVALQVQSLVDSEFSQVDAEAWR